MSGIELIIAERKRQIEKKGFTAEHDDKWKNGELTKAAVCYLYPGDKILPKWKKMFWPWDTKWWKPSPNNRIHDLVKAAALIAADIDRLLRNDKA